MTTQVPLVRRRSLMETLWVESEAPEARPVFPPSSLFSLLANVSMAAPLCSAAPPLKQLEKSHGGKRCLWYQETNSHWHPPTDQKTTRKLTNGPDPATSPKSWIRLLLQHTQMGGEKKTIKRRDFQVTLHPRTKMFSSQVICSHRGSDATRLSFIRV